VGGFPRSGRPEVGSRVAALDDKPSSLTVLPQIVSARSLVLNEVALSPKANRMEYRHDDQYGSQNAHHALGRWIEAVYRNADPLSKTARSLSKIGA
jgi:hypothetical protein